MARQRAPKGQGSIEQLSNGNWRVVVSGIDPVNGKRVKRSRTFDEQRQAVDFKSEADDMLKQKLLATAACLAADGDGTSPARGSAGPVLRVLQLTGPRDRSG